MENFGKNEAQKGRLKERSRMIADAICMKTTNM
jgi:hypothetical protein